MKRIFGIVFFFCSISTVFAFQNEPDGFRGIKWGTDLSRHSDLVYSRDSSTDFGGIKIYISRDEDLQIGGARVDKIEYYAWQDKFFKIQASTSDLINSGKIYQACIDNFGDRMDFGGSSFTWKGGITKITVTEPSYGGNLFWIESAELSNKLRPFERQKELERGSKGF